MESCTVHPDCLPLDFLQFAHHCEVLSDGRPLPRQQDFSLTDVMWLDGRIYEIDVLGSFPDYYFRKFGIFWQAVYGENFAGHWLSEIELRTTKLDALRAQYDQVVSQRAPQINRSRLIWPDEAEITLDRLMIPFTLDGETVSQIVVAAHFDSELSDLMVLHGSGLPQLVMEEGPQFLLPLAS
jgi:hypothetical protein